MVAGCSRIAEVGGAWLWLQRVSVAAGFLGRCAWLLAKRCRFVSLHQPMGASLRRCTNASAGAMVVNPFILAVSKKAARLARCASASPTSLF